MSPPALVWRPVHASNSRRVNPIIGYELYAGEYDWPIAEIVRAKSYWTVCYGEFPTPKCPPMPLKKLKTVLEDFYTNMISKLSATPFG